MDDIQTATDRERTARFTALYVRDHPRVSAFVHRRIGDRGTAEELTAEVFRIAWERILGGEERNPGAQGSSRTSRTSERPPSWRTRRT